MTTALYRRYRPDTFAEVIGQEHVTAPLSAALAGNRVSHAYLFSGPRGCGKTTSARILARCLNCEQGPTPEPCGTCDSCVALARGGPGSLDVLEIDAASHRGIDDAREIRERAAFAPASSRFKIFIIDEAHMVTKEGFNALLKTVEEPPEHVKFVFATTEPDKVIGTIRSRTHHYPFRLVPPGVLTEYLTDLCRREGVSVGEGVLPLVVRAGAGSVRDSLSVLDQLIAGAGPEGVSYQLAVSLLGFTDASLLDTAVTALGGQDAAGVFRAVDAVVESGHDPRRFVEDLLQRLRDLLVLDAVPDGAAAVLRGVPEDQLDRMRQQAALFGRAGLSRAADVANAALTEMTGATSPRLHLELLCARLLLPAADDSVRGVHARLDQLEQRMSFAGAPVAPIPAAPGISRPPADQPPARPAERPAAQPAKRPAAQPAEQPVAQPVERPAAQPAKRPAAQPVERSVAQPAEPERQPVSAAAPPAAEAPAAETPAAGGDPLTRLRGQWPQVLDALAEIKRFTWTLISVHAQLREFDGKRLVLAFDTAGRANTFSSGGHPEFLRQALLRTLNLDCAIEAVAIDGPGGSPGGGTTDAAPGARSAAGGAVTERGAQPRPSRSGGQATDPPSNGAQRGESPAGETSLGGPATAGAATAESPDSTASTARGSRAAPATGTAESGSRRLSGRARLEVVREGLAPAGPPAALDEPSPDDLDVEGSDLVGAPVIEQLLGGRVIEERAE